MNSFNGPPPRYNEATGLKRLEEYMSKTCIRDNGDEVKLIIGLDFGTTYSGVAYAFSNKPDAIYTVDEWPGAKGRRFLKCPTLIQYDAGGGPGFKWGLEVERTSEHCIEGIKLMLDPTQRTPIFVSNLRIEANLKKLRKPAEQVAADYIHALHDHALKVIKSKSPQGYIDDLPKQYVLSVPAVWSDKAKSNTERAARNAGISPVTLIKEPEAAALFTIHSMREKGLKAGDALVLCDAGGGTVDLISYEIKSLEPFELVELTQTTGGLAGSLLVNHRFEQWIENVVGMRAYADLREKDAYRRAIKMFDETIKPEFQSKNDPETSVHFQKAKLKDDPDKGLEGDCLTITGETLFQIFDPIFQEIDGLIKGQVDSARLNRLMKHKDNALGIKAIFLVGGFGSNQYLFNQVTRKHPNVQVIQPPDAWSAIVCGAVMSQLPSEAHVVANIANKHYGVSARSKYNEARDAGRKKHWDDYRQVYRVSKMKWYIEKGDDLERARTISFNFYESFAPHPSREELQFTQKLLECSLDDKPFARDDNVTVNCVVTADLSRVPEDKFLKKTRGSKYDKTFKEWWELDFNLVVKIESGPMVFSLEVGGQEYGQAMAEY